MSDSDDILRENNPIRKLLPPPRMVVDGKTDEEIKQQLEEIFAQIDLKKMFEDWAFEDMLRSFGWYRFPEVPPKQAIQLYDSDHDKL